MGKARGEAACGPHRRLGFGLGVLALFLVLSRVDQRENPHGVVARLLEPHMAKGDLEPVVEVLHELILRLKAHDRVERGLSCGA